MSIVDFNKALTHSECQVIARLTKPNHIQAFLDELVYSADVFRQFRTVSLNFDEMEVAFE